MTTKPETITVGELDRLEQKDAHWWVTCFGSATMQKLLTAARLSIEAEDEIARLRGYIEQIEPHGIHWWQSPPRAEPSGERETCIQTSDAARAEVMRLMREDFDPTPPNWEGRDWDDNAEDVADEIIAAVRVGFSDIDGLVEAAFGYIDYPLKALSAFLDEEYPKWAGDLEEAIAVLLQTVAVIATLTKERDAEHERGTVWMKVAKANDAELAALKEERDALREALGGFVKNRAHITAGELDGVLQRLMDLSESVLSQSEG